MFGSVVIIASNQPYHGILHRIDKDTCSFVHEEKTNYMQLSTKQMGLSAATDKNLCKCNGNKRCKNCAGTLTQKKTTAVWRVLIGNFT